MLTRCRRTAIFGMVLLMAVMVGAAPAQSATVPNPRPQLVEPRPGMDNVHPTSWESYRVKSPRTVRIFFWGGPEPCDVLDSVQVQYFPRQVRVTLYSGNDPEFGQVVCPAIAIYKAVDVRLAEPLNGRPVVDGTRTPAPATDNVTGQAVRAPEDCPINASATRCAARPVGGATMVVTRRAGGEVARDVTGNTGTFSFSLPDGRYTLVPQPVAGLGSALPVDFVVKSGEAGRITVFYEPEG
jgi:hypothetical protein